jgi:hypothetical protein
MAIVLANLPTQQATKNAAMTLLTHSYVERVSEVLSSDGLTHTVNYVYATGEPDRETTVVVRRQYDAKNDITRTSLRLLTEQYDDADDTIVPTVAEAGVFWNVPGQHASDIVDIQTLLSCAFSLAQGSFDGTSGIPSPTVMTNTDFGLIGSLW